MDKCCEYWLGRLDYLVGVLRIMDKSLIDKLNQVAIEHQRLTGERVDYVNFTWVLGAPPFGPSTAII